LNSPDIASARRSSANRRGPVCWTRWLLDNHCDQLMLMRRDVVDRLLTCRFVYNVTKETCDCVLCVVCTRQYVCLSSVDSPSISLGDQSRVSEGRKGVLNGKGFLACFVSPVYLK
jgi:hypothetical protein